MPVVAREQLDLVGQRARCPRHDQSPARSEYAYGVWRRVFRRPDARGATPRAHPAASGSTFPTPRIAPRARRAGWHGSTRQERPIAAKVSARHPQARPTRRAELTCRPPRSLKPRSAPSRSAGRPRKPSTDTGISRQRTSPGTRDDTVVYRVLGMTDRAAERSLDDAAIPRDRARWRQATNLRGEPGSGDAGAGRGAMNAGRNESEWERRV